MSLDIPGDYYDFEPDYDSPEDRRFRAIAWRGIGVATLVFWISVFGAIGFLISHAHAECIGSPGSGGRGCQDAEPQACTLPERATVSACTLQRLTDADRIICLSRQAQARPAYKDVILWRCVNNFTNRYSVEVRQ